MSLVINISSIVKILLTVKILLLFWLIRSRILTILIKCRDLTLKCWNFFFFKVYKMLLALEDGKLQIKRVISSNCQNIIDVENKYTTSFFAHTQPYFNYMDKCRDLTLKCWTIFFKVYKKLLAPEDGKLQIKK